MQWCNIKGNIMFIYVLWSGNISCWSYEGITLPVILRCMYDLAISATILIIWVNVTFLSVPIASNESKRSCICVLWNRFLLFYIDFGTLSAWIIAVQVQYKRTSRKDKQTNINRCIIWHLRDDSIPSLENCRRGTVQNNK